MSTLLSFYFFFLSNTWNPFSNKKGHYSTSRFPFFLLFLDWIINERHTNHPVLPKRSPLNICSQLGFFCAHTRRSVYKCAAQWEREGRASAHFIRYIAQHVTFMMRHQTILHRKWWGAHARCCCCRFSRLYTTRRSRAERGLYSTPFAWTICIEIGEFFHFKRETYTHRRGYRKPANEPPALNIHNITTLYYYDDYYYTRLHIMYYV